MSTWYTSPVAGLAHLRIQSVQPDRWRQFATSVLGLMPVDNDDGGIAFRMDERSARIVVTPGDTDGVVGIGWEVRGRERWQELIERLEKAGFDAERLDVDAALRVGARQVLRLSDPSGFPVELVLAPLTEPVKPFVSPTGARFVTGDQAMGHITVVAWPYEATVAFYTDVLGFHVRESIDLAIGATFASCNPRQHSIAIIDGDAKEMRHFDHLMLEVDDIDVMGRSLSEVKKGAAPLIVNMGRHWNDEIISFYVESPSGFLIEYGYGGRRVDSPDQWTEVQQAGVGGASRWGHEPTELAPDYF